MQAETAQEPTAARRLVRLQLPLAPLLAELTPPCRAQVSQRLFAMLRARLAENERRLRGSGQQHLVELQLPPEGGLLDLSGKFNDADAAYMSAYLMESLLAAPFWHRYAKPLPVVVAAISNTGRQALNTRQLQATLSRILFDSGRFEVIAPGSGLDTQVLRGEIAQEYDETEQGNTWSVTWRISLQPVCSAAAACPTTWQQSVTIRKTK